MRNPPALRAMTEVNAPPPGHPSMSIPHGMDLSGLSGEVSVPMPNSRIPGFRRGFTETLQRRGAMLKWCLWTPLPHQKCMQLFCMLRMHASPPRQPPTPIWASDGHVRSFQTVTCPPMTRVSFAVLLCGCVGSVGRIWGRVAVDGPAVPAPMRASAIQGTCF